MAGTPFGTWAKQYICGMQRLNFPTGDFRFKSSENKTAIFDRIRKKFVILTPEEWVRQHAVHYLQNVLGYPLSLINVEKTIRVNKMPRRFDIVVYSTLGTIDILVECKAPHVQITQATFDQAARYNMTAGARYLMVTNGLSHYCCAVDYGNARYDFMPELPAYRAGSVSLQP